MPKNKKWEIKQKYRKWNGNEKRIFFSKTFTHISRISKAPGEKSRNLSRIWGEKWTKIPSDTSEVMRRLNDILFFFCVILNFSRKQSWGILGTKENGDLFLYLAVGCFVHFSFCLLLDGKMQQFNNKRNLNFERRLCWKSLQ